MYFVTVALLLLVFPAASIAVETLTAKAAPDLIGLIDLTGKWFTFWAVGVRLVVAGVRQVLQPRFTAETIFQLKDESAFPIVREVGFGNLSMGALGLIVLARADWIVPAAIVGGLYYGLAGMLHVGRGKINAHEAVAMISDIFIFLILAGFVVSRFLPLPLG